MGTYKTIGKTTINDIARALNITPSTVSRALNDHGAISKATKNAVQKTARRLNYQPNRIASALRLGKSYIIGVIIPSAEINFFGLVVHGIEKIANANGYNVLIYQTNELMEAEKRGLSTFLRSRVDGVLASISKETTSLEHYKDVVKRGVPLVLFDRANFELGAPTVVVDDYKGAYNATCHLIEQGCKHIAHIGGQQHVYIFKQRLKGFVDALQANNINVREELIIYGDITIESAHDCMQQLLALSMPPDGVFAVEDFTALGALQALKDNGLQVPDDVALIGFANEAFGNYITPSLSTVDQQAIKMGEEAAKLLFKIPSKNFYENDPIKVVLEPKIIARGSTLKLFQ